MPWPILSAIQEFLHPYVARHPDLSRHYIPSSNLDHKRGQGRQARRRDVENELTIIVERNWRAPKPRKGIPWMDPDFVEPSIDTEVTEDEQDDNKHECARDDGHSLSDNSVVPFGHNLATSSNSLSRFSQSTSSAPSSTTSSHHEDEYDEDEDAQDGDGEAQEEHDEEQEKREYPHKINDGHKRDRAPSEDPIRSITYNTGTIPAFTSMFLPDTPSRSICAPLSAWSTARPSSHLHAEEPTKQEDAHDEQEHGDGHQHDQIKDERREGRETTQSELKPQLGMIGNGSEARPLCRQATRYGHVEALGADIIRQSMSSASDQPEEDRRVWDSTEDGHTFGRVEQKEKGEPVQDIKADNRDGWYLDDEEELDWDAELEAEEAQERERERAEEDNTGSTSMGGCRRFATNIAFLSERGLEVYPSASFRSQEDKELDPLPGQHGQDEGHTEDDQLADVVLEKSSYQHSDGNQKVLLIVENAGESSLGNGLRNDVIQHEDGDEDDKDDKEPRDEKGGDRSGQHERKTAGRGASAHSIARSEDSAWPALAFYSGQSASPSAYPTIHNAERQDEQVQCQARDTSEESEHAQVDDGFDRLVEPDVSQDHNEAPYDRGYVSSSPPDGDDGRQSGRVEQEIIGGIQQAYIEESGDSQDPQGRSVDGGHPALPASFPAKEWSNGHGPGRLTMIVEEDVEDVEDIEDEVEVGFEEETKGGSQSDVLNLNSPPTEISNALDSASSPSIGPNRLEIRTPQTTARKFRIFKSGKKNRTEKNEGSNKCMLMEETLIGCAETRAGKKLITKMERGARRIFRGVRNLM